MHVLDLMLLIGWVNDRKNDVNFAIKEIYSFAIMFINNAGGRYSISFGSYPKKTSANLRLRNQKRRN